MQQAAGREAVAQPPDQHIAAFIFLRPERRGVPFRAVHVVDGNKRRLAAHRQPHVVRLQIRIHLCPSASIAAHCSSSYGLVTRGSSWMRVTDIENSNFGSECLVRPFRFRLLPI